ncbi:MAG: hypothetical protein NTW28_06330 [Candidatus Solibacter sp.]|nr:hypothetical protein [Candidatus Solibacter sp.]
MWQNAFHVRVGLQADHERDWLVRHIHVDVLLLAVVEQVELEGLQPVHVVAVAVEDQHRRLHHLDTAAEYGGYLGRVRLLGRRRLGKHNAAQKG